MKRSQQLNALLDIEPARAMRRIEPALRNSKCNRTDAAKRLGISKPSLDRIIARPEVAKVYHALKNRFYRPSTFAWRELKANAGDVETFNQVLVSAIRDAGGRVKKAAKVLKVNFFTLYRYINSPAFEAHRAVLVAEFTHLYQLAEEDRKRKAT